MLDFSKVKFVIVFLEEPDDISFCVLLNILLVVSRLRVVDWLERLQLAHRVDILDLSQNDLLRALLVLEEGAEEVSVPRLMVKHRCSI